MASVTSINYIQIPFRCAWGGRRLLLRLFGGYSIILAGSSTRHATPVRFQSLLKSLGAPSAYRFNFKFKAGDDWLPMTRDRLCAAI